MKRYLKIFCIFSFFFSSAGYSQDIGITIGYGTFKMEDLKALNEEIASQNQSLGLKTTNNFPGFLILGANGFAPISEKFELGGQISLASTGSRMAYSDYSGSMTIDQKLYGVNVGVTPRVILEQDQKNMISLEGTTGITVSGHSIKSSLQVGDETDSDLVKFSSLNLFFEPGFRYGRILGESPLRISVRMAYNINVVKGKLLFSDDKEAFLTVNEEPAHADWSGFRTEINFSYIIRK